MKELDLLLQPYLEQRYPSADDEEKADFRRLLDEADPALWQYFTGGPPPEDPRLASLVAAISRTAAPGP
jgi:antitoxin CptB